MTEETLGFLGLMRRAGALALGAEDAFDAAREHRARLICLAQDAGKNTRDGLFNALEEGKALSSPSRPPKASWGGRWGWANAPPWPCWTRALPWLCAKSWGRRA